MHRTVAVQSAKALRAALPSAAAAALRRPLSCQPVRRAARRAAGALPGKRERTSRNVTHTHVDATTVLHAAKY